MGWLDLKHLTRTAVEMMREMKHQTGCPKDVYRPRPSRRMECEHEFGKLEECRQGFFTNWEYSFRHCPKCNEIEWVG